MNLLEHHAKALLAEHGLPTPHSWLVRSTDALPEDVKYPVVAKSQVPVGGRGKAGGIVSVDSASELSGTIEKILALDIKGHRPTAVLLEEKLSTERELYLSLRLNRDTRTVEWLASPNGGVEIEENASSVKTIVFGADTARDELADTLGVQRAQLDPILDGIEQAFFESDLLLLEVNPLIEQSDGSLICADAKCLVDDNARFRHPELPWPPSEGNPPKPLGGNIGCIANGAGMAMSTMDTIVAAGGKPANFLDIGGGTGEKEFVAALRRIMELPGVTSIIVNIFAGISRCDEIARGIIAAREQLAGLPPLFIRLEGTNRDIAAQLLTDAGVSIKPDLKTCVQKALMEVNS
jgi:succinyl-CoA synthetase beta subunit